MSPEWGRPRTVDLKEKSCWDRLDELDEMFTDEEPADNEGWAGANPGMYVWPVCVMNFATDIPIF
jgi:hypothetical protein